MKNLFMYDMNGQSWLNVSFSLHQSNLQDPKSKRNKYLWFRVAIVIPCDMRGKLYLASLLGFFPNRPTPSSRDPNASHRDPAFAQS